jgi:hypothetical protein
MAALSVLPPVRHCVRAPSRRRDSKADDSARYSPPAEVIYASQCSPACRREREEEGSGVQSLPAELPALRADCALRRRTYTKPILAHLAVWKSSTTIQTRSGSITNTDASRAGAPSPKRQVLGTRRMDGVVVERLEAKQRPRRDATNSSIQCSIESSTQA